MKGRCIRHILALSPTCIHLEEKVLHLKRKGFQNITAHIQDLKFPGKVQGLCLIPKQNVLSTTLMTMELLGNQLEVDTTIVEMGEWNTMF